MKFPRLNKNKGFTLFELLVTVFIIGLLSSILVVNWRRNENQYQLQTVVQTVAQDIRKTQQMALTGAKYSGQIPNSYGLYFTTSIRSSYVMFADKNDDKRYTSSDDPPLETMSIESGYEIDSLNASPAGVLTGVSVTFNLPDGFTNIRKSDVGGTPWQNSLTITIRKVGTICPSATCKDIVINKSGQISIQ